MAIHLIKSNGAPKYAVWVRDRNTQRWHCWGQVADPEGYPNLLEEINSGKYYNSNYKDNHDYDAIQYLPNDGEHCPNK